MRQPEPTKEIQCEIGNRLAQLEDPEALEERFQGTQLAPVAAATISDCRGLTWGTAGRIRTALPSTSRMTSELGVNPSCSRISLGIVIWPFEVIRRGASDN
jgi:hypothetical protein